MKKNKFISCGIVLALIVLMITIVGIETKATHDAYLAKKHQESTNFAKQTAKNEHLKKVTTQMEYKSALASVFAREEKERKAAELAAKKAEEERLAQEAAAAARRQRQASVAYTASAQVQPTSGGYTDPSGLRQSGVLRYNGTKWTWYTQRILPGQGLNIPGRHLDENGLVCDGDGNVVLASSTSNRGQVVDTPFGKQGKVYDAGNGGSSWYDVYTDW